MAKVDLRRYKAASATISIAAKSQKPADLIKAVESIADYYHTSINSHLFGRINASLFMTDVNAMLRALNMFRIPHGDLDMFAINYDYRDFRKIFLTYVRDKI